jgi:hypothetical protein
MLITAAYPFSKHPGNIQFHIHSGTSAPSHTFARSHCPPVTILWVFSSSSSSPVTQQHSILESSERSSITDRNIIIDEPRQSFKMHYDNDALEMGYDPDESDHHTFNPVPENPRIESLRLDKCHGVAPPYCTMAPALFPRNTHPDDIELGQKLRLYKPTPLRNIALSNVPKWQLYEYQREPEEFLLQPGARFEKSQEAQKWQKHTKKALWAAEPSLDGLSACKSYTETRRSMSKNLLEDYEEVLKMWQSRPEGRAKFQGNDKPSVSENKRRPMETANCSQFSKRLRTGSGSLECVSRDDTAEATKALPTHTFEEPPKRILTMGFESVLEEVNSKSAEGSADKVSCQESATPVETAPVVKPDATSTVVEQSDTPKAVESQRYRNENPDPGYRRDKEKSARKKDIGSSENVQALEFDLDPTIEEQSWALFPIL